MKYIDTPVHVDEDGDLLDRDNWCVAIEFGGSDGHMDEIAMAVNYHDCLVEVLGWALEWIDSVPSDIDLPVMPGFDRDYVNGILAELSAHNGGEG